MAFIEEGVRAEVKHTIVADIVDALRKFDTRNVLSKKGVRSFVRRSSHAVGLLVTLRPFPQSIWASLSGSGNAPTDTIWKRQIQHALGWMKAFLNDELPGLQRRFTFDEDLQRGLAIEMGTDASPFGMGGWLSEQGVITKFFACEVSEDDLEISGIERGSCKGQQVLDALAILVAMRPWHDVAKLGRLQRSVRGDNIGALSLVVKMRPASAQADIVARELALLTARARFPPRVTQQRSLMFSLTCCPARMTRRRIRIMSCRIRFLEMHPAVSVHRGRELGIRRLEKRLRITVWSRGESLAVEIYRRLRMEESMLSVGPSDMQTYT